MADYQSYKQINGGQAITANSLGPAQVSGFSTAVTCQFFVCNSDYWTHANGGCCLYWTVPGKALTVRFELTAGGGSGSISACYHNGPGGGGGAYAVKTQFAHKGEFTSGSTAYTICAGGSSQCSCCGFNTGCGCCGRRGCTSYVNGGTLSNFCAVGGSWGFHQCSGGCYSCSSTWICCRCWATTACWYGADFGIRGTSPGRRQNQYCMGSDWSWAAGAAGPWGRGADTANVDNCSHGVTQGCCRGHSLFPGGGGHSPYTDGSCCWGGYGQGGLVVVTYWS